jgi:hypothetical protein
MAYQGLCIVSNAGIRPDGRAAIFLKYPNFPQGKNYSSAPNQTREVLAIALAAIASNKQVFCDIPNETDWADIAQINLMSGQ